MSRRRHRLTALVAAAVAGATLAAAPATADSRSHRDRTGDVSTTRLRAAHTALDITRTVSTYAYGRLTLSTSVVSRAGTGLVVWKVRAGGETYFGLVSTRAGEVDATLEQVDGGSCRSAVGAVDGETARLVVPVACLDDAPSARVGSYTIRKRGPRRFLVDDAYQGRLHHRSWPVLSRPIAYSP